MPEQKSIPPLEELVFAEQDYVWDAGKAARRLQSNLGWAALAVYSLAIDVSADAESYEAYKLLIADYVGKEPKIVPQALKSGRKSISQLGGNMRETAEHTLAFLEAKYSRQEGTTQNVDTEAAKENDSHKEKNRYSDEPQDTDGQCVGTEEASRIVERLTEGGQVLPAWGRDALIQFISGLSAVESLTADGFEKISPVQYFTRLLESLPSLIPTDEAAGAAAPRDNSLESLGKRIAQALK